MRTMSRVFAVSCLLGSIILLSTSGCAIQERLDAQKAHMDAIDLRLDAQDRFLEDLKTETLLALRSLRRDLSGLDKYVSSKVIVLGDAVSLLAEQVNAARRAVESAPQWPLK